MAPDRTFVEAGRQTLDDALDVAANLVIAWVRIGVVSGERLQATESRGL